jgi:thymidylate synthase (FAD)
MRETTPKVHLIASPAIHIDALMNYVRSVGGEAWVSRINQTSSLRDGEVLSEAAGRLCYRSWDVGLNPNVTKVREDSGEYLLNILKTKHGSVLEHANYTFIFEDVSRVFTHELVRHRAGVAISQESLRYVRLTDIGFRIPPILEEIRGPIVQVIEMLEDVQKAAAETFDLDKDGLPFKLLGCIG